MNKIITKIKEREKIFEDNFDFLDCCALNGTEIESHIQQTTNQVLEAVLEEIDKIRKGNHDNQYNIAMLEIKSLLFETLRKI